MPSGIYCIVNLVNGKKYYGSSNNINRRWGTERSKLNNNKFDNSYLQNSWNKYGKDSFYFFILEEVEEKYLRERKQKYLDNVVVWARNKSRWDYNIAKDAFAPMRGRKFSEEHRKRIGIASKGKVVSEETKNKISEANKGHRRNTGENHPFYGKKRPKISKKMVGKGNHFYGKRHTTEAIRKIQESSANRKHSKETKKKIGKSNSGENSGHAKLKRNEVLKIRKMRRERKLTQKEMANIFNVSCACISNIITKRTWKHL